MVNVTFLYDTKIRTSPTVINDDNVIGLINKGTVLTLSEAQVGASQRSKVDGDWRTSDKWFSDKNNWFYWEGATDQYQIPPKPIVIQDVIPEGNYERLLLEGKEPPLWWHNNTSAVKIAVVDMGFNLNHPALQHLQGKTNVHVFDLKDIKDWNLDIGTIQSSHRSVSSPNDWHGTTCLSILAAQGERVQGVLNNAEYYLFKVEKYRTVQLLKVLEIAKAEGIQVIACSLRYRKPKSPQELATKIEHLIDELGDKVFITMALSNDDTDALTDLYYPLKQAKIVGSVALRAPFFKKEEKIQKQEIKNTSFAFRYTNFCTVFSDNDSLNSCNYLESSFTVPIIAALAGKILAQNEELERKDIIKKIAEIAASYDEMKSTKDLKFYVNKEENNNQHLLT